MIYFTADLHLGHKNILQLCRRPFSSIEQMDAVLIDNWNRKVKKNDTVYVIGDLIWDKKKATDYLSRLQGKKILITGNHDRDWLKEEGVQAFFLQICPYLELKQQGLLITMCHYPMLEWNNSRKEDARRPGYLIHGHIHNRIDPLYQPLYEREQALNAGVDINGYAPVTFEELVQNNNAFKANYWKENV